MFADLGIEHDRGIVGEVPRLPVAHENWRDLPSHAALADVTQDEMYGVPGLEDLQQVRLCFLDRGQLGLSLACHVYSWCAELDRSPMHAIARVVGAEI